MKRGPRGSALFPSSTLSRSENISDVGSAIAVDSAGNAYVTGNTTLSEANFPVTVGPDLTFNGQRDAFVAKVRADGTGLVYCGYIGGSENDSGYGLEFGRGGGWERVWVPVG